MIPIRKKVIVFGKNNFNSCLYKLDMSDKNTQDHILTIYYNNRQIIYSINMTSVIGYKLINNVQCHFINIRCVGLMFDIIHDYTVLGKTLKSRSRYSSQLLRLLTEYYLCCGHHNDELLLYNVFC